MRESSEIMIGSMLGPFDLLVGSGMRSEAVCSGEWAFSTADGDVSVAERRMCARNCKHARTIPAMASTVARQPKTMVRIFSVMAHFFGLMED